MVLSRKVLYIKALCIVPHFTFVTHVLFKCQQILKICTQIGAMYDSSSHSTVQLCFFSVVQFYSIICFTFHLCCFMFLCSFALQISIMMIFFCSYSVCFGILHVIDFIFHFAIRRTKFIETMHLIQANAPDNYCNECFIFYFSLLFWCRFKVFFVCVKRM